MLFPYKSNCELFYNNSDYKYSFYFATQQLNQPVTLTFETISNGKSIQVQQLFELGNSYTSSVEMATKKAGQQSEVYSLTYNCKNKVFGAKFLFMGNPTFSVVAFFAGLTFNQSFAIYPLCIDTLKCRPPPEKQYHYHVLFGVGYSKDNCTFLDGVTIQMHQETEISLQLSGKVHVLNNTVEQLVAKEHVLKDQDNNRYTTLWIEPKVLSCERVNLRSLEGTNIISNKPVTVFTNRAKCSPKFSYDSQVVHQMPEVNDWGKMFIIDMQQHRILPESMRNYLEYEIAIRTVHNDTTIYTTYHPLSHQGYVNTIAMETTGVHRIMLRHAYSHVHISATSPVLVLYSIRSRHGTQPHIYFSVLQQPVEWYSNKQTIVLQHPTYGEVHQYHISVVIAKEHYNPRDIYIAEDKQICRSVSLLDYNGFTGNINEGQGYVVFYMEPMITGGGDGKTLLLLWHRNSEVYLGVTVFAYARDLQYAYGNGYTLGKFKLSIAFKNGMQYLLSNEMIVCLHICFFFCCTEPGAIDNDEITCWRNVSHLKTAQFSLVLSIGLVTTGLVISALCLVLVCFGYCRLRNKGRDKLGKSNQDELILIEGIGN